MNRSTVRIDQNIDKLKHAIRSRNPEVRVYVDATMESAIGDFMSGCGESKKPKTKDGSYRLSKLVSILLVVLKNQYDDYLYRLEDSTSRVTAMKFMDRGHNDRLYCKEISLGDGVKRVVINQVHLNKKTEKNGKEEN